MALVSPKVEVAPAAPGTLARADHEAAFEAIYQAEIAWVHRTLRRLGARPADLEDLAHDVFVAVHRALDRYDASRPIRPWLFGIAFRVVSDYRSRARFSRERATGAVDDPPADGMTPESALADRRARELLLRALDALPVDQRAAFVASELDEMPMPELAAQLGVSVNTLYSRLRLARARFSAAVAELTREGGRP
ncbi:MAG: sigma-70 family RNA polymerase sigma factor [Deltaproteobacteria bacterium]|nr:sigma-70 family RNA polymerase sigma factor [Deltaproteobacteria bacterium]